MINKDAFLSKLNEVCATNQKGSCLVFAEINNATQVASFIQGFAAEKQLVMQIEKHIMQLVEQYTNMVFAKLEHNRFAFIILDTVENSILIAQQIASGLDAKIINIDCQCYYPKLYLGITPLTPDYNEPKLAFAAADAALNEARLTGGSIVKLLSVDAPELVNYHRALRLLPIIREGLLSKSFVLFAQPIVALGKNSKGKKVEVLLRYQDSEGRFYAPYPYLSAAELFHVSREIDLYVVHQFCVFMQNNIDKETVFSLNIAGNTVRYAPFFDYVKDQFEKYQVDTQQVCFEMTENVADRDMEDASILMRRLKDELGCQLSLDDIGVGSSNLATMPKFNVDYMKIDGSYIRDFLNDPYSALVVSFINEAAKLEGKQTIAEFVETTEQMEKLRVMGIDYGQGYLLGKPALLFDPTSVIKVS